MLKHWTNASKVSCIVVTYAALPRNDSERFEEEDLVGWSSLVIRKYAHALEVDVNYLEAYRPLLRESYALPADTMEMIEPFLVDLVKSGLALQYLMELYIFLVTNGFYDARGRVTIRNCVDILQMSREDYFALEVALAHSLHECEEQLARAATADLKKDSSKMKRYMKIGAVGLGAGAVIAFTGGLAAPAVAAALLAIGGASAVAAGFATVTVLASVFGTAGAGLAGYKMARRTKGIEEFEFEQFGENGQLAVTIMVSGWMDEEEDYKRTFGVLPSAMTLQETLTRFYLQHDRAKVVTVKSETADYEQNPHALVDKVKETYGLCPLMPSNLTKPYTPISLSEKDQALLDRLIDQFVLTTSSKSDQKQDSSGAHETEENTKIKKNSSIGKSAGRLFKGAANFTSSMLSSKEGRHAPASAPEIDMKEGSNINIDVAATSAGATEYDVGALDTPTLLRGRSVPSGTPTIDIHLLASASSAAPADGVKTSIPFDTSDAVRNPVTVAPEDGGILPAFDEPLINNRMSVLDTAFIDSAEDENSELRYWNWTELDVAPLYELYLLKWESPIQLELGTSLKQLMKSLQHAVAEKMLMFTVAGLVMSAVALPYGLLKLTDMIDSTWVIALRRADEAGKELAEALLNRPQGSRPVTLVGHSIGARLIFSCLVELARRRNEDEASEAAVTTRCDQRTDEVRRSEVDVDWASTGSDLSSPPASVVAALGLGDAKSTNYTDEAEKKSSAKDGEPVEEAATKIKLSSYGLIQDVVLLGVPVNTSAHAFSRARSIVTGRFVNGYSSKDLCLAFLYRWGAKEALRVAGLQAVDVEGVENVDLSFIVEKHTDYSIKMKQVLTVIDFGRSSGCVEI